MSQKVKRLFNEFKPNHYILDLTPDREKMTFSGSVIIAGRKTGRPSKRLTLHQNSLKIKSAHISRHDKHDQEVKIERINLHKKYDEVRLHTTEILYPGKYTVRLEFSGKINIQMNGIYPCFFKHEGEDKKLIATQFESHHAREVFPCIDEPEAKSTFDLILTTPADETVIANMPAKHSQSDGKNVTTSFETTPHMSTYLLAFVFGDMDFKEARTKDGTTVRAYATPDNVEFTSFALDFAVKCLEFYNDYFGIDYPLAKCDLVALPDFASGAMENWGCITFREQTLLVDPKNSTLTTKQYVAMVVAHELAHQWFGNLVTMRWWTDLWLNEGFASWIEFMAVDHIFPEWEMWTQFSVDERQQALKLDALEHTHPIEVPVNHPDEIRSIFDAISYSKGASVINMLHEYLGHEAFRGGLKYYLNRHAHGNTDTVDLWQALEEVSGKPVKDFMAAWTTQPGFPVLRVNVSDEKATITQERFFINPKHAKHASAAWPIALLSNTDSAPEQFSGKSVEFELNDHSSFNLNIGQTGFYRTAYNSSHLQRLGELIKKGHVDAIDRLGILSDVFETAKAGQSDTADALHFLENFRHETNYAVWDVIASSLGNLRLIMGDDALRSAMKPYIRSLVQSELKRLGWDRKKSEPHFDRLLRPIILGQAAIAEEKWVVERCRELFDAAKAAGDLNPDLKETSTNKEVKRGVDIDPDMRGVVFGTISRNGTAKDFAKMVKMHNSANLSEERTTLAAAITGFKQPELIDKALAMINSDQVRLQDVAYWIAYSFLNRYARDQTWQWLKDNWQWLHKNLGNDLSFYRTPIYAARVQSEPLFKKEYVKFFQPKLSPALERSYNQGLEMLDWQTDWKQRDFKEVLNFFKSSQHK